MTVKLLATGVAAVAAVGAAAAGLTSLASGVAPQVTPVVLSALLDPPPLDPPPPGQVPTAGELSSLCTNLTNPGVSYHSKDGLVEGGINGDQGRVADHDLRKAFEDGKFPQSYDVTNIRSTGPNSATADVAISGPKLPAPVTQNLTFINQGGWVLRQDSAQALLEAATR